uniref:G-protein coupled receptors family 1 profile domain-containing protein n=1 Tax=Molossus molossus TaxID=27622 RepID=A0A7J8I7X3_MOLMO|nr:hypothetical protein HJG59_010539 [Molossus molossus]
MPHTVNMVWCLNLAMADFIISLSLPLQLMLVALHYHRPFGQWLWKLNSTTSIVNFLASVLLLTFISMNHCVVTWPIQSRNYHTQAKVALGALEAWLLAISFYVPYLIFKETIIVGHQLLPPM